MIKQNATPKVSDRGRKLATYYRKSLKDLQTARDEYVAARVKEEQALSVYMAVKNENRKAAEEAYKPYNDAYTRQEVAARVVQAMLKSISKTALAYVLDTVITNADILDGEHTSYKRTREFVNAIASGLEGCSAYIDDTFHSVYINVRTAGPRAERYVCWSDDGCLHLDAKQMQADKGATLSQIKKQAETYRDALNTVRDLKKAYQERIKKLRARYSALSDEDVEQLSKDASNVIC